jgi:hypothetical protein
LTDISTAAGDWTFSQMVFGSVGADAVQTPDRVLANYLTAAAVVGANAVLIGSDGARGMKTSLLSVTDAGLVAATTAGTLATTNDLLTLTQSTTGATGMASTLTDILFRQHAHEGSAVNFGRIGFGAEGNITADVATQDSYFAIHTCLNGTLSEAFRTTASKRIGVNTTNPSAIVQIKDTESTNTDQLVLSNSTNLTSLHIGVFSEVGYIYSNAKYRSGWSQDNAAWSSWGVEFGAGSDAAKFRRSPAGSTTFVDIVTIGPSGIGVGTSTAGASAAKTIAIANGTAPTAGVANQVEIYSVDCSLGSATLGFWTEQAPDADVLKLTNDGTGVGYYATHFHPVLIQGVEYFIPLCVPVQAT